MKKRYNRLTKLTAAETARRDAILADFLFDHKGRENAVSSKEILEYLRANGYSSNQDASALVSRVAKQRHLPICSLNKRGYYWAENKADIQLTIEDLESRIECMQDHIDRLKGFMLE